MMSGRSPGSPLNTLVCSTPIRSDQRGCLFRSALANSGLNAGSEVWGMILSVGRRRRNGGVFRQAHMPQFMGEREFQDGRAAPAAHPLLIRSSLAYRVALCEAT